MSQPSPIPEGGRTTEIDISVPEFVALVAALMSLNALAIDIMLPALPHMGADLGVDDPNHRQYVVIAYVFGLGIAQLFFGPASDRFGRRGPLLVSLVGYSVFGVACIIAPSFWILIAARALQGVMAAGARVISLSIVRDVHAGRRMARIMSLVMMVFMAVPMLAPNIGALVLMVAPWRWIFVVLAVSGLAIAAWIGLRLKETLPPERRRRLDLRALVSGYWLVFKTRISCGYMVGLGVIFGALFSFVSSSEQLYALHGKQATFTLYFASVAGVMGVSAFLNSRLVERLGMRILSHAALVAFTLVNLAHLLLAMRGIGGFARFHTLMLLSFGCFAFIGANFNALAMEPLGEIAGTASAALGFASTMIAATLGGVVGQQFDGTVTPIVTGFFVLGACSLAAVLVTERGRLFGKE